MVMAFQVSSVLTKSYLLDLYTVTMAITLRCSQFSQMVIDRTCWNYGHGSKVSSGLTHGYYIEPMVMNSRCPQSSHMVTGWAYYNYGHSFKVPWSSHMVIDWTYVT